MLLRSNEDHQVGSVCRACCIHSVVQIMLFAVCSGSDLPALLMIPAIWELKVVV
jgi:hypothetical protein